MNVAQPDWSPADNPHAITISEAQWWQRAVQLAVLRLRDPDDERIAWFSSRQIDARQLVFALRQLLSAARLVDVAMQARGIDAAACEALARARQGFGDALAGSIKDMRDALMHFEDWSRGQGCGPQKGRRDAGQALRDVVTPRLLGLWLRPQRRNGLTRPLRHRRGHRAQAAQELSRAIYQAARAVDQAIATGLLARTADVLTAAGISSSPSREAPVWLRVKDDSRVWLSLVTDLGEDEREDLPDQIIHALTGDRLRLVSIRQAEDLQTAERLVRGEALFVEVDAA
jgi:hypothetical protein